MIIPLVVGIFIAVMGIVSPTRWPQPTFLIAGIGIGICIGWNLK